MSGFRATLQQEVLSARRERMPQVLLVVFLGMVSVSSLIGWLTHRTVTSVWETTRAAGLTTAPNPFAHAASLSYVKNVVIYVVLIGALLAIVLGVSSTLRSRKSRTTDLVLSRPVDVAVHLGAKLTGMAIWLGAILAVAGALTWVSIALIMRGALSSGDTIRLAAFFGVAWVFLLVFVVVGMLSGIHSRRETSALLLPIVAWSVIVFVLPQLGTAALPVSLLNPVAAVPVEGGAFAGVQQIVGPFALGEQFKTLSGAALGTGSSGSLGLAAFAIVTALAAGLLVLLGTRRDHLRRDLRD